MVMDHKQCEQMEPQVLHGDSEDRCCCDSGGGATNEVLTMTKCLYPKCEVHTYCRGLCLKHYGSARNQIKTTELTWQDLEQRGKCLYRQLAGGRSSEFVGWLKE